jgi:hypothetical protein
LDYHQAACSCASFVKYPYKEAHKPTLQLEYNFNQDATQENLEETNTGPVTTIVRE